VAATWPAVGSLSSAFMANDRVGAGEPPAGDHLQSVYRFWLVGRQLEHGGAPWKDPYSFQPLVEPQTVLGGWPFGFLFWPLNAAFGPVVAWNLLLLGTIVAAGLLTYRWLRCLELGPFPAGLGGLAFAIAPYRLEQSAGHLLGWIALFLPLALLAIERARVAPSPARAHAWGMLAALSLVSIALAGQLHLALGAVPLVLAYAAVRFDRLSFAWTVAGALAAAAIGVLIRYTLIAGSPEDSGRSLGEVRRYSAEWVDFANRWHAPRSEEFVYLGWLLPLLALVGLAVLARQHRGLAILLGLAVALPVLLALGTNLPLYSPVWHHFPPLRFPRVPGRLLPIADLALAALAAFAAADLARRARGRGVALVAVLFVLVALDLTVQPLSATAADPGNAAYRALASAPPGRVLALPLFEPGVHYGSVYDYYQLQEAREQPGGYSTLAPEAAFDFYFTHNRLNCGVWLSGDSDELERLGITRILFHRGLYAQAHRRGAWFAWRRLQEAGFGPVATGDRVTLFAPEGGTSPPPMTEPPRSRPVFCTGWKGRTMLGREATIWLYGEGGLQLRIATADRMRIRLLADGHLVDQRPAAGGVVIGTTLVGMRWHPLLLVTSRAGLRLSQVSF
jgi:hypothetical protein